MRKEKPLPLSEDFDNVRRLESSKLVFRNRQNALESGNFGLAYEWFEDSVIQKRASVEIGRDATGKATATIKMLNPKTNEKEEEVAYYTTDETEVASLKKILAGKTVKVEVFKEEPEIKKED